MGYRMQYDRSEERTTITTDDSSGNYSMGGDDARRAASEGDELVVTEQTSDYITLRNQRTGKEYTASRDTSDTVYGVIGLAAFVAFVCCLSNMTHFAVSAPAVLVTMPFGFPVGTLLIALLGGFAWLIHEKLVSANLPILWFGISVALLSVFFCVLIWLLSLIGWCDPFSGFFETVFGFLEIALISFLFLSYALLIVYAIRRFWREVCRYAFYITVPTAVLMVCHGAYGWVISKPYSVFEGYTPHTPLGSLMERICPLNPDYLFNFIGETLFFGSTPAVCITGLVILGILIVIFMLYTSGRLDGLMRKLHIE